MENLEEKRREELKMKDIMNREDWKRRIKNYKEEIERERVEDESNEKKKSWELFR